jgi:hypothetical protein
MITPTSATRHPKEAISGRSSHFMFRSSRKVLILDVDRDWYEPYWISDDQLFRAMTHKTDMFGFGGYVFIDEIKKS